MKKNILYTIYLTILAGALIGAYIYFSVNISNNKVNSSLFIKNLTWQTNGSDFVPFKKNDSLDFTFVFDSLFGNSLNLNISKLEKKINIKEIYINDEKKDKNSLKNIHFKNILKLRIVGDAIQNSLENENIKNDVEVELIGDKPEEIVEEEIIDKTKEVLIFTFNSQNFNSNINNVLEISGQNLELIDYLVIGEKKIEGIYKDDKFYARIEKNIFGNGDFFVGFYLKNGKLETSSSKLTFSYNPNPINIAAITPDKISNKKDSYVVIQGNGFNKIVSLQLSNNYIFKNTLFNIINNQVASVKIPSGLTPGVYYFNIMDTKGIYNAANLKLTIN
ncbi:hypothetical protein M0P65_00925 [Candidatus Gracilibacteria bacterium]|nr:hypothetical protein [Candidatus Gracilibacteria bacterium]